MNHCVMWGLEERSKFSPPKRKPNRGKNSHKIESERAPTPFYVKIYSPLFLQCIGHNNFDQFWAIIAIYFTILPISIWKCIIDELDETVRLIAEHSTMDRGPTSMILAIELLTCLYKPGELCDVAVECCTLDRSHQHLYMQAYKYIIYKVRAFEKANFPFSDPRGLVI